MMKRKYFMCVLGILLMTLAGCSTAADPTGSSVEVESTQPAAEVVEDALLLGPADVTRDFYEWYLGVSETTNPLVSGAYRDNENLSPAFVESIDATLASFDGQGAFDPILLAQDVPVQIEVGEPVVSGQEATVPVLRYWGGNPEPSPMMVTLVHSDGRWLIESVSAGESLDPALIDLVATAGPAEVVQVFYDWYLDYIGDRASENFRNPLVDRAYHQSPLLTDDFKNHLDEVLDQEVAEFGGYMADPILCAQDIPQSIMVDVTRMNSEGVASSVVSTSFSNHLISVDLRQEGESWLIRNITCPGTPAGTAKVFYDWYLGYIGDWTGDFRNPLVDRAYRDHPLLADSLEQEIDMLLDGPDGIQFDPFLLAQDVPATFSVDPGLEPDTAIVHLHFGPDSVRHILVTVEGNQIVSIDEASPVEGGTSEGEIDTSDWMTYIDSGSGVAFDYPPDWVVEPLALDSPGMPDDWPVVASWMVMPVDVAEALAARSGSPDPDAPIIVSPIQIEIVSGGQDQLLRVIPVIDGEAARYGEHPATVVTMEPGYHHYIVAKPQQPDHWFVLTDWVTGFPGREDLAEGVYPVVDALMNSLTFTP
jgi:hypothetical protein